LSTSIAYQAAIARARELDGEHAIVWAQRAGSTAVHALGLILVGRSRSAEHVLDAAPATDRRARVVRGWLRLIHDDPFQYDVQRRVPDTEKAKKMLGFEAATTLDQMLDEVIPWIDAAIKAGTI